MKESEEKALQDYLSGRDGVSAAYRSLSDEKPSAALDASIRQAAQEAVDGLPAGKKRFPLQVYSLAASICVAVLVVSLFLNNEDRLTRNELDTISAIPLMDDAPTAELFSAGDARIPLNENAGSQANDANADLDVNAARVQTSAAAPVTAEAQVSSAAAALSIEADSVEAEGRQAQEARSLEELLDLARSAPASEVQFLPEYRLNADSWLTEIQRLTAVSDEPGVEQVLTEERRLFAERYPGIDIDSALAELEESDTGSDE